MYRKLLASTALSLVMAGSAFAQDTTVDPMANDPMMDAPAQDTMQETPEEPLVSASETGVNADGWLASEVMGMEINNSTAEDAETIGEVNDFVLNADGGVAAVVVGVGGFLGIGQKNVAIAWDELQLVSDVDGNQMLVAERTREQLESAAEFDRQEWLASESATTDVPADPAMDAEGDAMAPADPAMETEGDAMAPADPAMDAEGDAEAPADPAIEAEDDAMAPADPAMETEGDAMAPAGDAMAPADPDMDSAETDAMDWNTYEAVPVTDLSAEELNGTTVYGADDEDIGAIGDVLLSEDGQVEAAIIDFGGFLGIGTKPVAVSFEDLEFLRDEGDNLVLRTSLTEEQLDAAPEYDEDAYLEAPGDDTTTLRVQ